MLGYFHKGCHFLHPFLSKRYIFLNCYFNYSWVPWRDFTALSNSNTTIATYPFSIPGKNEHENLDFSTFLQGGTTDDGGWLKMGAVGGLSANRLSWRKRAGQENPQNLAALSRSVYCMALKATGDRFFLSFFSLFFGATALYTYLLYGCAACARACLFVSLFVCQSVSLFGWLCVPVMNS